MPRPALRRAGDVDAAAAAARNAVVEQVGLEAPVERGRTLLVLGQIQRRRGERRDARVTLAEARALFSGAGATYWADRADSEIRRIGVRTAPTELTESELRVASLAGVGRTNAEIAAQLFVSRRTVEANLARAYRKLGIRSRAQLATVMADRLGHKD